MERTTIRQKYYLYRHIRLDKNEPFYIGVGTTPKRKAISHEHYYRRAYNSSNRNTIWKNITNKTDYEVEILLESDNYDFIKEKEIEFIKLYGRKDNNTGVLSNMTDGGGKRHLKSNKKIGEKLKKYWKENEHPCSGVPISEERKQKLREVLKGNNAGNKNYFFGKRFTGANCPSSKRVIDTATGEIYASAKEAHEKTNYPYKYEYLRKMISGINTNKTTLEHYDKPVKYVDEKTKLEFDTIKSACKELHISYTKTLKRIGEPNFRLRKEIINADSKGISKR